MYWNAIIRTTILNVIENLSCKVSSLFTYLSGKAKMLQELLIALFVVSCQLKLWVKAFFTASTREDHSIDQGMVLLQVLAEGGQLLISLCTESAGVGAVIQLQEWFRRVDWCNFFLVGVAAGEEYFRHGVAVGFPLHTSWVWGKLNDAMWPIKYTKQNTQFLLLGIIPEVNQVQEKPADC